MRAGMRRVIAGALTALVCVTLADAPSAVASASPGREGARPGTACSTRGAQATVAGRHLTCLLRDGRRVWVATAARTQTLRGDLTVLAAASLTESFQAIAAAFERLHPAVRVHFSFGASSALALQIDNGAPADVFASASTTNMQQVVAAGQATRPVTFARNRLIIVTPPDNPGHITRLADLARTGVSVAVCQAQVPCGVVATQVLRKAHLTVTPATEEVDVKSVLSKVMLGEVDAGLVYVTDAHAAGASVAAITIPARDNADTTYPIVALRASQNPLAAQAFVAFVRSAKGKAALASVGFTVL